MNATAVLNSWSIHKPMAVTSKKPESWRHTKIARKYYRIEKMLGLLRLSSCITTHAIYPHDVRRGAHSLECMFCVHLDKS